MSHFSFNKQERSGIFFLLLLIVLCQTAYYLIKSSVPYPDSDTLVTDQEVQNEINALKLLSLKERSVAIYAFNPNYIDDYKGYILGMSPVEIDKLLQYRALGKFVSSPSEFQRVSGVSDSLLKRIAPLFKFPEFKTRRNIPATATKKKEYFNSNGDNIRDLNKANANDLKSVYGIGEVLSRRIVKFRDAMGGFLVDDQLYDVYGIEPAAVDSTLKKFSVLQPPAIKKVNLNSASVNELAAIIYIKYAVAEQIIEYRTQVGGFSSLNELGNIADFPSDKIERIRLYLTLKKP